MFNGNYKMESRMPDQDMGTARTLLCLCLLYAKFGFPFSFVLARHFLAGPSLPRRFEL